MKWFLSIVLVLSPAIVAAKGVSLAELITKENNEVQAYSGFWFNVGIIKKSPMVSVVFVKVEKNNTNNNQVEPILRLPITASDTDKVSLLAQTGAVTNFHSNSIVSKPVDSDEGNDWDGNKSTIRFDFLDEKQRVKISEWRLDENGFLVKTAIFDKNGKVLALNFYTKLRFNDRVENGPNFGKMVFIQPNQVKEGKENLVGVEEVEEFSKGLLEKVLETKR